MTYKQLSPQEVEKVDQRKNYNNRIIKGKFINYKNSITKKLTVKRYLKGSSEELEAIEKFKIKATTISRNHYIS